MNLINQKTNRQLKLGVVLNYIVIFLNIIVGLLYTPYMLRMMGQSEYGLYSLVASVIAYLTVLDLGIGNAIVRYTAKFRSEGKLKEQYEMFGMFLVLYLFIGIVALLGGLGLYFNVDRLFGETMTAEEISRAQTMLLILVINLAFTFPMSIFSSILTAYEQFIFPKIIAIIRILLNTGIMIVLLNMGYKALAMVVLLTIFNVISLILNFIYCKAKLRIQIHFASFKWDFFREVAIYSVWIFLNAIMDRIYWSTGQFVLGAVSGTIAVSVFAVAIQLEHLYMQFSSSISSVFLPKITRMVTLANNEKEVSDLFIKVGRIQNIVMSFILFAFVVFGRPFVILWAGVAYEDAYEMALLFFVALYIPLIQNLGITVLQARNQMKFRSLLYIVIAIFALIGEYLFSKLWGGVGCAVAISLALLLGQGLIMNIYYHVKQKIDIVQFWKEILKMDLIPLLVTIFFGVMVHFVVQLDNWCFFIGTCVLYSMIYFLLCGIFCVNEYERSLIISPVLKIIRR